MSNVLTKTNGAGMSRLSDAVLAWLLAGLLMIVVASWAQGASTVTIADALQSTVGIRCGGSHGSGTIIHCEPGRAVVITCNHVFRDEPRGSGVLVDVFAPIPGVYNGIVRARSEWADMAVVEFDPGDAKLKAIKLADYDHRVNVGDKVYHVGCGHSGAPTIYESSITIVNRFEGAPNYCVAGGMEQGRSGGGLIHNGRLVGVIQANSPEDNEGLCGGLGSIHEALDRAGFVEVEWRCGPSGCERVGGVGVGVGVGRYQYVQQQPTYQQQPPMAPVQPRTDPAVNASLHNLADVARKTTDVVSDHSERIAALERNSEKLDDLVNATRDATSACQEAIALIDSMRSSARPCECNDHVTSVDLEIVNNRLSALENPKPEKPTEPPVVSTPEPERGPSPSYFSITPRKHP